MLRNSLLATLLAVSFFITNVQCMDSYEEHIYDNCIFETIKEKNHKNYINEIDYLLCLNDHPKYDNLQIPRNLSKKDISQIVSQVVQTNCNLKQILSKITTSSQPSFLTSEPLQENDQSPLFSQTHRNYSIDSVMDEHELIDFLFTLYEEADCQTNKESLKEYSIVCGFGFSALFSCGLSWCLWAYCTPQEYEIGKYIPSLSVRDGGTSVFDIRRNRLKTFSSQARFMAEDMMNDLHVRTGKRHPRMGAEIQSRTIQ